MILGFHVWDDITSTVTCNLHIHSTATFTVLYKLLIMRKGLLNSFKHTWESSQMCCWEMVGNCIYSSREAELSEAWIVGLGFYFYSYQKWTKTKAHSSHTCTFCLLLCLCCWIFLSQNIKLQVSLILGCTGIPGKQCITQIWFKGTHFTM